MVCLNEFIGVPYKSRGRDFDGADCLGIVALLYKARLGLDIPDYAYVSADSMDGVEQVINANKGTWEQLPGPQPDSVVILNIAGHPVHLGYLISESVMIHSLRGHNSVMERINGPRWAKRIEGFYKWVKHT